MLTTVAQHIFVHCPFTKSPLFERPTYFCQKMAPPQTLAFTIESPPASLRPADSPVNMPHSGRKMAVMQQVVRLSWHLWLENTFIQNAKRIKTRQSCRARLSFQRRPCPRKAHYRTKVVGGLTRPVTARRRTLEGK